MKTNLEAVKEIVRQIRLRDLGGIIVLDFIDMEEKKNRQKVFGAVEQELRKDRAPSKALQVSDWSRTVLLPEQVIYAALDAVAALQLQTRFEGWFIEAPEYRRPYAFLRSLIYPLVRQQSHGIRLDLEAHNAVCAEWQAHIADAVAALAADGLTNPDGVRAKQEYLAAKLTPEEAAVWPTTATGALSTSRDALAAAEGHPTLATLAEYVNVSARLANFGYKLQELAVDGVLYPSYQIAGMITGRYGCGKPNLQNQPRDGFKHVYVAPEGCKFVTGDLAQVDDVRRLRQTLLQGRDQRHAASQQLGVSIGRQLSGGIIDGICAMVGK